MKKKLLLATLLLSSPFTYSSSFHLSPEVKFGPYIGAGLSGAGLQAGIANTFGLEAIYLSYSYTSADFLHIDQDNLKTYRLGVQHNLIQNRKMSIQVEAGMVEYTGNRKYFIGNQSHERNASGTSLSSSWVTYFNDSLGFRVGATLNYIDRRKTFLPYSTSATVATGLVFNF